MSNSRKDPRIDRPVFLVGMPRSGTTVLFEAFARNPEVGWLSYHLDRVPRWTAVALAARVADRFPFWRKEVSPSDEGRRWLERFRDGPSEAYHVWEAYCGEKFLFDYLLEQQATPEERNGARRMVASLLRWEGKARFAAKLTGPARMGYVLSLFEDARFVHIVRDGRAVVSSLLRVGFWRDTWRMTEPAWRGGLGPEALEEWERRDRSPLVLAALQWRTVIERTREEQARHAPAGFLEVRYEEFVQDPCGVMARICDAAQVTFGADARAWLEAHAPHPERKERFRSDLSAANVDTLDELLGDLLAELGYA